MSSLAIRRRINSAITAGLQGKAAEKALKWVKDEKPQRRPIAHDGGTKRKRRVQVDKILNETGRTTRDPTVRRGKRLKTGHKKAVKVSKSLKDKIQKVLKTSGHKGNWTQISYGKLFPPTDNVQSVNYGFGGNDIPVMFNIVDWLHMISVMWNEKDDVQSPRGFNDDNNLGRFPSSNQIENSDADIQGEYVNPLTFHVYDCKETIHMKNNGRRTQKVEIYLCAPKHPMTRDTSVENDLNTISTGRPILGDVVQVWEACVDAEIRNGINVLGTNVSNYAMSPNNCPEFKRLFNVETTTLILEPGQTYSYVVQGPKNLEVVMSKMFRTFDNAKSLLMDVQKFSRVPIVCISNDLVTGVDSGTAPANFQPGRYNNRDDNNNAPGIIIERIRQATFICPDSVIGAILVKNPGEGGGNRRGTIMATKKQTRYARVTYTVSGSVVQTRRVDEENPITGQIV